MSGSSGNDVKGRKAKKRRRPLLIAGAVALLLGIATVAGVYIYIGYTNRQASQAQDRLSKAWADAIQGEKVSPDELAGSVARLIIPKIDLDVIVVELNDLDDTENLKKGPGHVPGTAYPGEPGNVLIAGHRTTYGAKFSKIDTLEKGDRIILELINGKKYLYVVSEKKVVDNNDLSVLGQDGEPRVTLSACHPRHSARERYIVVGRLAGEV